MEGIVETKFLQKRPDDVIIAMDDNNYMLVPEVPEKYATSDTGEPVYLVRVISPVDHQITVPKHWHPKTDEYFRVFVGTVIVSLDGKEHSVTPDTGEFHIPAGSIHGFHVPPDVHTEFAERAVPDPARKAHFLRRLSGRGGQKEPLSMIQVMTIFYQDGDTIPSTGIRVVDYLMVNFFGGFLGTMLGLGKITPN